MQKVEYTRHPLSAAFPDMSAEELDDLIADIEANGQKQPIVLYENQILDGWHRYQACTFLGRPPQYTALPATVDPVAYVLSLNVHRRHLNASQRAVAVVTCREWAQEGANQHRGSAPGAEAQPATVKKLAEEANVSPRTIEQAKRTVEAGLADKVRDGELSVKRASEVARLPEPERQVAATQPAAKKPEPKAEACQSCAELQEQVENLAGMLQEAKDDNESMAKAFEADDKLAASEKENARLREENRIFRERNNGLQNELAQMTRAA
jgi:hypothetical protein